MNEAAQPKLESEVFPLSPWCIRTVLIVMALGFAVCWPSRGYPTVTRRRYRRGLSMPVARRCLPMRI